MTGFFDPRGERERQRKQRVRGYATMAVTLLAATVAVFLAGFVSLLA